MGKSQEYHRKIHVEGAEETDWNEKFQIGLTKKVGNQRDKALSKISINFSSVARLYGQIIIRESCLKFPEDRAIKTKQTFGGVAGGIKILARNTLFKLCKDQLKKDGKYMYGIT